MGTPVLKAEPKRRPRETAQKLLAGKQTMGFARLLALAVDHFGFGPEDYAVVSGRLRHLQKQGLVPGSVRGSGNHADYSYDDVLAMMIAMSLGELGISLAKAARLVMGATSVRVGDRLEYPLGHSKIILNIACIEQSIAKWMPGLTGLVAVMQEPPVGVAYDANRTRM
jgi:hypothetical protein